MKILVTGGVGFIGTALIKKLLNEGHNVHSLDNYEVGVVENEIIGCNYITGDIENIGLMDRDFDLIFHLAALSRIQPSFNNPEETFRVNSIGTQKVCEFARLTGTKVVYAGSSSRWHDPYQSPYAACKHIGEEACKMYKKTYGMDIEIVRFYNVYGPGEIVDGDWAAVIGKWRRQVRDGEPITIVGNGEQRRDFTHIDDIIDGLWKIGMKDLVHEDAWELGTGMNYSINDVYLMFKERFGCDYINLPDQSGNYKITLRENDDSLDRLGWKPYDKLRDYIINLNK
jgi:UDP-glucose 4-epimerase|tara:strand:- start:2218 stop:3069 length:852 start_codon:yes stop_codon:yes gene_type:complete